MATRLIIALVIGLCPAVAHAQQPPTQPPPSFTQQTPIAQEPGSRPVPDPTVLTTLALEKSISAQRELFEAKLAAIRAEIDQQRKTLDATDDRATLRLDRVPDIIEAQIVRQQKLVDEKFKGVDQQFAGRDVALAAALLAQKTSVDEQNKANAASSAKAEGATTKQIDGIQLIITANSQNTDGKIEGVKALLAAQAKSSEAQVSDLRTTITDLRTTLAALQTSISVNNTAIVSRGSGQSESWMLVLAIAGLVIGPGIGLFIAFNRRAPDVPAQAQTPQVIYVQPTPATLPTAPMQRV